MALYWNCGRSTSIREGIVEIYDSKGLYICCVEDHHNFKAGYLLLNLYGVKLLVTNWKRIKKLWWYKKTEFWILKVKAS
jgi:hypothetical protein